MTALAQIAPEAVRADRYQPTSFETFGLAATGDWSSRHTRLYDPLTATTLDEALAETTSRWSWDRGDRLGIREIGDRHDQLHVYAVRKKSVGHTVYSGHHSSVEHRRWLDHICTIDLNIIAGIDVIGVGGERQLFEHRQAGRPERARLTR